MRPVLSPLVLFPTTQAGADKAAPTSSTTRTRSPSWSRGRGPGESRRLRGLVAGMRRRSEVGFGAGPRLLIGDHLPELRSARGRASTSVGAAVGNASDPAVDGRDASSECVTQCCSPPLGLGGRCSGQFNVEHVGQAVPVDVLVPERQHVHGLEESVLVSAQREPQNNPMRRVGEQPAAFGSLVCGLERSGQRDELGVGGLCAELTDALHSGFTGLVPAASCLSEL